MLTIDEVKRLVSHLRKSAPILQADQLVQSRRIDNEMLNEERDLNAYAKVFVYVQQGMSAQRDLITQVLRVLVAAQPRWNYEYPVGLFALADDGIPVYVSGRHHRGCGSSSVSPWVNELSDLANTGSAGCNVNLKELLPPVWSAFRSAKSNLYVFIVSSNAVSLSDDVAERIRRYPKQFVWVHANVDGEATWKFGLPSPD